MAIDTEVRELPFRYWHLSSDSIAKLMLPLFSDVVHDLPENDPNWVSYANSLERGKRAINRFSSPTLAELLFGLLESPSTVELLRKLTSIDRLVADPTRHGAGIHVMEPGGWLQGHVDYELHPHFHGWERRLNLILFLHDHWEPDWGGELLLMSPSGKTIRRIPPIDGTGIVFECGPTSYHGVRVIANDATRRITAACYYLAPARISATRERAVFFPNRSGGVPDEVK